MFFAPHLAQQAEEEAAAAAAAADEPRDPAPRSEGTKEATPSASDGDGVTRVVGTVERVQVELKAGAVPGAEEAVTLPDGRVVKFTVPASFKDGEIIEVEVSRQRFQHVTRDELKQFFENGIAAMESEEARREVEAGRSIDVIVEIQQRELDKLGIDRKSGCQAAGKTFTDDAELRELQQKFMRTAQVEFVRALEAKKPAKPSKQPMSRADILEFFQACNTKVSLPETRARLAADSKKNKNRVPNELMIKIQRDMLETLGFEADHGCACLNRIQQDFGQDVELANAMRHWAITASNACKLAVQDADPDLQPDSKSMQDMTQIQQAAAAKLGHMSEDERTELISRMRKKVDVFQKLSAPDRLRYIKKLNHKDKLDFVMAQNLLMVQMQAQMSSMGLSA